MTHGTLVWRARDDPSVSSLSRTSHWWKSLYRPVLASFSGRRRSREPLHEGWIDKEYFGY
jgi:hypothetical protein